MCGASARAGATYCPQCGGDLLAREVGGAEGGREEDGAAGVLAAGGEGASPAGELEAVPGREAPPTREFGAVTAGRGRREVPPTAEHSAPAGPAPAAAGEGVAPAAAGEGDAPVAVGAPAAHSSEEGVAVAEGAAGVGRRERAAGRVRGVRENLKPRVERMRDEALVALDEGPADSGLRFVVIAVMLFLVFIVFLALSVYVLG